MVVETKKELQKFKKYKNQIKIQSSTLISNTAHYLLKNDLLYYAILWNLEFNTKRISKS